jgi:ribose 5-phosphate isomerase RpiB
MIELVDSNDARAARNKDNVLALYELMINKKEAEQAVAEFFAPEYIQHIRSLQMVLPNWRSFSARSPMLAPSFGS